MKIKNIVLSVLAGLFGILFLLYLFFVPVRVVVDGIPDPFYLDQKLTHEDFKVYSESVLKHKKQITDYYYKQDGSNFYLISGKFYNIYDLKPLVPESYDITYDTKVYVGQKVDVKKLHVKALYSDGEEREVRDVVVPSMNVPMANHCTIQLGCNAGRIEWETDVIKPESVTAVYDTDAQLGDLFDMTKVVVTLFYSDDTEYVTEDFEIPEPPSYLTGKLTVNVVSDYGNVEMKIRPQNMQRLKASYKGKVYVGDMLDPSKFSFTMKTKSGETKKITDFTFDDPGPLKTDTNVILHSNYGDGFAKVKPIRVKGCKGDTEGELVEGKMPEFSSVTLYYEDGRKLEVPADQVEFTNLTDGSKAGVSTVYFIYHGVYYWFELSAIPTEIVNLRKTGADIPDSARKYKLTNAQVDAISIVCQRLAGDDLEAVAAEASLLANRYELYGMSNEDDKDGSYLVKYMIESGYWGQDVGDYISNGAALEDVAFVVEDVLKNGYRSLPLYIDERAGTVDIKSKNRTDFEKDQTVITKSDGVVYRFYGFSSQDLQFAYGYTDTAYQKVTGSMPVSVPDMSTDLDDVPDDGIIIE